MGPEIAQALREIANRILKRGGKKEKRKKKVGDEYKKAEMKIAKHFGDCHRLS